MTESVLWFATRGAGIVSLVMLTGVVCLGVLTSTRWQAESWPRFLTAQLHRNISLLAVVFLAIHIVTAVVDPYTSLGWMTVIVPFSSPYRRLWLGLGVVAFDLLLALILSSLLRARIGIRAWRVVHWAAYLAWPAAVVHGYGTGSDLSAPWMLAIDALCVAAALAAVGWRVLAQRAAKSPSTVIAR
ncbi:MAG: ferric reductase-like transmembrane domain-containing protein [Chloroflexota bacterium]|nr:ferric reductase-like transmembrane domain-containing protein [Chloroflexota bacterium]